MSTIVFPGQGDQAKGMGGTLFDDFMHVRWTQAVF